MNGTCRHGSTLIRINTIDDWAAHQKCGRVNGFDRVTDGLLNLKDSGGIYPHKWLRPRNDKPEQANPQEIPKRSTDLSGLSTSEPQPCSSTIEACR